MAVTINPIAGRVRLEASGDIETVLTIPYDDDDRFLVGFSDGTLLQGTYDASLRCSWTIARQGAALVDITGAIVVLEGLIEWVTASAFDQNVVEPHIQETLPLFPELDRWAA